jgi:hypothetical protein
MPKMPKTSVWKLLILARPERLELPTYWFEARRSIQLSYGRAPLILAGPYSSATTGFTSVPIPSTSTSTVSPGFSHFGGL